MSQFPLPPGQFANDGMVTPGAPALGPGREIVRVVEKSLADGRRLQFVYIERTFVTPERTYVTEVLSRPAMLDCSCSVGSPSEVFCCASCHAAKCFNHTATCASCGVVFCSACSVGIVNGGLRAIVCVRCARALRAPLIVRAVRRITSWLWD